MCSARMPREVVVRYSSGFACLVCRVPLRISGTTRVIASTVGLLVGWVAAVSCVRLMPMGGWGFQVLWAIAGFAIGSAGAISAFADLQVHERHSLGIFPQRPA